MRQKLIDLYEIQKIDIIIRDLDKKREAIPQRLNQLEATANQAKTESATLTEQRDALVREIGNIEGTVFAESDKLKKWEKRLADIRNQREYLALQREVEASKKANREAEAQMQELAQKRNALQTQIDTLQAKVGEQSGAADAERESVKKLVAAVEEEAVQAKNRRQTLIGNIPQPLLRKYDAIRTKRFGVGLVVAVAGSCQGCNMKLPPQLFNILQRADTIEQCPSCQRLVFWEGILSAEQRGPTGVEVSA